jgi:hypothetical protein
MTDTGEWSPDEPSGEETFEPGDEARDEEQRLDPGALEGTELDPSLDPALQVDWRELEEVGGELDDPEEMVMLEGGIDDPDGLGSPSERGRLARNDDEGWDLDAGAVPGSESGDGDVERS